MDKQLDVDRKFFTPVAWFDFLLKIFKTSDVERIEKETNTSIHSINDLLKAFDKVFEEKIIGKKASAIKFSIAYTRSLEVKKRTKYEAEKCFNKLFNKSIVEVGHVAWQDEKGLSQKGMHSLQDYLIHYTLRVAESINLPVKIHTGMQEGHNFVTNSNPVLLLDVFNEYKKVKFDIMHGGYPYTNEIVCIGKVFQNVYLDTSVTSYL
ncbi:MAG: amidohydrolase family protein [Candidatus Humimicrobiaceae bacterium]